MIAFQRRRQLYGPGQAYGRIGDGLVGYWGANEGGGALAEDLHRRRPGKYNGAWTQSFLGPAMKLDGSTTYLQIVGEGASPGDTRTYPPITFQIWLFWAASTDAYNNLFTDERGGGGGGGECTFLLKSNQQVAFYNNGSGVDPIGSVTVPFNQWVHLMLTWDGTTVIWYMNGIAQGSGAIGTGGGNFANEWDIGGNAPFSAGRYINGSIRDAGIWNRLLTPSEIQELYYATGVLYKPRRRMFTKVVSSGPSVFTNVYPLKRTQVLSGDLEVPGGSMAADITQILTEEFYN